MKSKKILIALLGWYLALWHGGYSHIPWFPDSAHSLTQAGFGMAVICIVAGLMAFFRLIPDKRKFLLALAFNLIAVVAFFFYPSSFVFWMLMAFQGYLLGLMIRSSANLYLYWGMSSFSLVLALSTAIYFISKFLQFNHDGLHLAISITMVVILLLSSVLVGKIQPADLYTKDQIEAKEGMNSSKYFELTILTLLLSLEISLFVAALLLPDTSQSLITQLTLPLTLVFLFLLRVFIPEIPTYFVKKGWLFVLTLLITISCGFFFTMQINIFFIATFSIAMFAGQGIAIQLNNLRPTYKTVGVVMISIGIISFIFGLYTDNHISYISSIKMPASLLNLSAYQAWMKELSNVAAIAAILAGIRYIR
ncbi:MAG: hypothetical protein LC107_08850 [Chitinophagales bacterium]|nr:hypothetical protein [Chitinophagales bacterium]